MDRLSPVYTEKTECQDCYKCVRECIPKAIRVENGRAQVMPDRCVLCGHCVAVCPVGAKRVRNDLPRAQALLASPTRVYASLAPSFAAEFPTTDPQILVMALEQLGFAGVSETALGAQEVSARLAHELEQSPASLRISTACPTAVEFVSKYYPQHVSKLTSVYSPLQSHALMLKQEYGEEIGVVFIGPCVGKKREADKTPDLVDVAITFEDLRRWFDEAGIDLGVSEAPPVAGPADAGFVPVNAEEGAVYPIEGGMVATMKRNCSVTDAHYMAISGVESVHSALGELDEIEPSCPVFVELLACDGGCVNGPRSQSRGGTIGKRHRVLRYADYENARYPRHSGLDISHQFSSETVETTRHAPSDIRGALRIVGKYEQADELNCGSCGYETCRDFAVALIEGHAEQMMCAGYMRKIAQKKANALLKAVPSGVVIVDSRLRIVECNENFARLAGEEAELLYDAKPGLEGVVLSELVDFAHLFRDAVQGRAEVLNEDIRLNNRVLNGSVFVIERGQVAGGIFQDVTAPWVHRDRVVTRAQEVIRKNLATVQQIASLMGENAAETEAMLNSIIDAYGGPGDGGPGDGGPDHGGRAEHGRDEGARAEGAPE
ncbi:MAG: [Fe-Fe] hydrogenase large subunit C-terminal domain-containing protein [Spirochaetota bacterium]